MPSLPSQAELQERLSYVPQTGVLRWNARSWVDNRGRQRKLRFGGKEAGCLRSDGKVTVGIDGSLHLAHRVIWKLVHGVEAQCLDHLNGNPTDNRLANLRDGSRSQNNRNCARRSDNTSGCAGVSYRADRGVWRAYLQNKTLGSFATAAEAIEARRAAQLAANFTERHGR